MRSQVAILIAVALVAGLAFFKKASNASYVFKVTELKPCEASTWNTCATIKATDVTVTQIGVTNNVELQINKIIGLADCESNVSHVQVTKDGFIPLNVYNEDVPLALSTTKGEETSTSMTFELPMIAKGKFFEKLQVLDVNRNVLQCVIATLVIS